MSRRSIIRETEEELVQEAEVVMRWSKKRIFIAVIIFVFILAGLVYGIKTFGENASKVLGANISNDKPEINIPNQKNVQDIIDTAKKDLSNINAKNVVESQPQLQKVIDDLTHLTGSSNSAKNLICDTLCK